MIVITNKKTYINGRLIFLKSTHHCWLELLRWLVGLNKHLMESLVDRNTDEMSASSEFFWTGLLLAGTSTSAFRVTE